MVKTAHFLRTAVFFVGALSVAAGPADAGNSSNPAQNPGAVFDGRWIIDAMTGGMCPIHSRQLTAYVRDGHLVSLTGLPATTASGVVDPSGALRIKMRTLGYDVHVHGRLSGTNVGSGGWSSNNSLCAGGAWRAHAER